MPNSASQALAEFKSQHIGGLLSGISSTVDTPITGLGQQSAAQRLASSQPSKSSTAFLSTMRDSATKYHQQAMQGFQQKQMYKAGAGTYNSRYSLPGKAAGGYTGQNGRLGPNGGGGDYGLTIPASNAFRGLSNAYAQQFGQGLQVEEGYRSIETQNYYWQQHLNGNMPQAVAEPGTSVHGWGQAVDLAGAAAQGGTSQHRWLEQNAAQFKWFWVGQNFGEDWHWEYHPEW